MVLLFLIFALLIFGIKTKTDNPLTTITQEKISPIYETGDSQRAYFSQRRLKKTKESIMKNLIIIAFIFIVNKSLLAQDLRLGITHAKCSQAQTTTGHTFLLEVSTDGYPFILFADMVYAESCYEALYQIIKPNLPIFAEINVKETRREQRYGHEITTKYSAMIEGLNFGNVKIEHVDNRRPGSPDHCSSPRC